MDQNKCIVCSGDGTHRCSGCLQVRYCSKEHQKAHWKVHKLNCKPYQMKHDATTGYHLVATRNIEAGAIILQEEPLLVAPKKVEGSAVCLGCCTKLEDKGKAACCPNCTWPMCGKPECWADGSPHALGECSTLEKTTARNVDLWASKGVYETILVLRFLTLKDQEPEKWKKIVELKHCGTSRCTKELEVSIRSTIEKLNLDKSIPDSAEIREWIVNFCAIFFINSFELPFLQDIRSRGLLALYSTAGLLDHSCVANATKTFSKDGQIIIRAAVPISKGSKITLNYLNPPLFTGTMKRQIEFEQITKFNLCRCERCRDPTELGSFTSGVYCTKCPANISGILLPANPLERNADWICNKCPNHRQSFGFILKMMKEVEVDWIAVDRKSLSSCEAFLRKYGKMLHPNHHFLVTIKLAVCDIYVNLHALIPVYMSETEDMHKKVALTEELLKILDLISPGLNHLRGYLLYASINHLAQRSITVNFTAPKDSLLATKKRLEEIVRIFSLDPEDSVEGEMRQSAAMLLNVQDISKSFQVLNMSG